MKKKVIIDMSNTDWKLLDKQIEIIDDIWLKMNIKDEKINSLLDGFMQLMDDIRDQASKITKRNWRNK